MRVAIPVLLLSLLCGAAHGQLRSNELRYPSMTHKPEGVEVVLCVNDPERTVAFYQDLGLDALVSYDRGVATGGWVVIDDRTLQLSASGSFGPCEVALPPSILASETRVDSGSMRLFLRLRDLDSIFERAAECMIPTSNAIGSLNGDGLVRFGVVDPDGNYITFIRAGGWRRFGILVLEAPDNKPRSVALIASSRETFWRGSWEGTSKIVVVDGLFKQKIPTGAYRLQILDENGLAVKEFAVVIQEAQLTRIRIP